MMFVAALSALAAVGCGGDEGTTPGAVGMTAGTTGTPAGTAGTGTAATAGASAAGTGTTSATAGTGSTARAGTGASATAGTGAATTAGTGAAATAGTGAAAAGTGAAATAGTGAAAAGTGAGAAGTGAAAGGATFADVAKVFERCLVCHGMPAKDGTNGNFGGVTKATLHAAIVNKPMAGVSNMCMGKGMYVVPGNPAMSMLLQKVSANPPCGATMPPGDMLTAAETKTLTDWIMAGAPAM